MVTDKNEACFDLGLLFGPKLVIMWFIGGMRKISLVLVLLLISSPSLLAKKHRSSVTYYSFPTDIDTEVVSYTDDSLVLKVTGSDDDKKSPYPNGTILTGTIQEHRPARRFFRSEVLMVKINEASMDGNVKPENLLLKVKPRAFLNTTRLGYSAIGATALVLGLTLDTTVVGLPVSRGGFATWGALTNIQERPENSSKLKAGSIGFLKGAFYPLPQFFGKSRKLAINPGDRLHIDRERKGTSVDANLFPPRDLI